MPWQVSFLQGWFFLCNSNGYVKIQSPILTREGLGHFRLLPPRNTEFRSKYNLYAILVGFDPQRVRCPSTRLAVSFIPRSVGRFCAHIFVVRHGTSAVGTAVRIAWFLVRLTGWGANAHRVGVVGWPLSRMLSSVGAYGTLPYGLDRHLLLMPPWCRQSSGGAAWVYWDPIGVLVFHVHFMYELVRTNPKLVEVNWNWNRLRICSNFKE